MSVFLFQKLIFLGLMHTLFALEDRYGLTIEKRDGETLLRFDPRKGIDALEISQMVSAWASVAEKYSAVFSPFDPVFLPCTALSCTRTE